MARIELEPAWILHRRPYRESSYLLEILTMQHGRIGAIAKGARGKRSRYQGLLEPFRLLLISWTARGDLATLGTVEPAAVFPVLKGDTLWSGLYLNELLVRLLHRHDPVPELFTEYGKAVEGLSEQQQPDQVLRIFEKRLLDTLGYGLVLDMDHRTGEAIVADAQYHYAPDNGPMRLEHNMNNMVSISGLTLQALANEQLSGEQTRKERAAASLFS